MKTEEMMSDERICQCCLRNDDRSQWESGEWDNEPNRVEFEHNGMPCLLHRNYSGAWCGYAAVNPGHPLHGVEYNQESEVLTDALENLKNRPYDHSKDWTFSRGIAMLCGDMKARPDVVFDVHGGLTYSGKCQGCICHIAKPGEPDDVWWFGFDCSHSGDASPGRRASFHKYGISDHGDVYRDMAYVRSQTERLAEQLSSVGASCPSET